MPKKHTPGFKTTKPQAAPHSSLASRSNFTNESHAKVKTVNERLQELRISQGPRTSSNSGLPPPLPEPREVQHQRRNHGRIAGPPPPRSWTSSRSATQTRQLQGLESSRHAHEDTQVEHIIDDGPTNFPPPPVMPDQPLAQTRSLRATTLRSVARNLSWHIAYQQDWLDFVLTARIKCELLATIASCPIWNSHRLNKRNMRYLFGPQQDSYGQWSSGGEGVTHLSFGAELKQQHDYIDLAQYLKQEPPSTENSVPESWDETDKSENEHQGSDSLASASDSDPDTDEQLALHSVPPSLPFLPSLTHLSLARPCSPCWPTLLEIGSLDALCHLTHLDLSYWPAPTLIASMHDTKYPLPNAALRMMINAHEDTEREIIRVFNQLGKACRKLVWLGLEGCESWLPSLMSVHYNIMQGSRSRYDIDGVSTKATVMKADWTGVWCGLETLKVAQSWTPQGFSDEKKTSDHPRREGDMVPTSKFREWWVSEQRLRAEELQITRWRLEAKQPALKFEKTPIQSWVELEIRSLNDREAVKFWKSDPGYTDW